MLMAVIANVNRGKGVRPYKQEQFMPRWDPEAPPERKPEMSGQEMLRAVKSINNRMGGRGARQSGDAS
jgi:hypothetical protein